MELQGDEAPNRIKPPNQYSILTIPEEVITEILLRLPVKSLLQVSCVSKSWLSLISSPIFVKAHLLLSATNKDYTRHRVMLKVSNRDVKDCSLSSLLYDSVTEVFDLDYPGKNRCNSSVILGSFNGLICLSNSLGHGLYDLFMWNPSIRKYKELPNYRLSVRRRYESFRVNFSFAYDEFQDDYKVVTIYTFHILRRVEVNIYSLKSNSWRRINDSQGRDLFDDKPGKLVNRKLFWRDSAKNIVSFDLAVEKWEEVEQPCHFKERGQLVLGVFGSDLSAFCYYGWWVDADVWVMKEYGVKESWIKMFTIKSPDDSTRYILYPPIFMSNEGEILFRHGSRLAKYNPKDDLVKYLDVANTAPYGEAEIYIKSLVCPF